jgi:hypothetical protein
MSEQQTNARKDGTETLEDRLLYALERKPVWTVPDDFAARVARRLPGRSAAPAIRRRYGLLAMKVAMAVLLAALLAVARRPDLHGTVAITVEWILCGQLAALAVWYSGVRSGRKPKLF